MCPSVILINCENADSVISYEHLSYSARLDVFGEPRALPNKPMVPTAPLHLSPTRRARCGGTSASRWAASKEERTPNVERNNRATTIRGRA